MGREDELGLVRVGQWVLEEPDELLGVVRVQARRVGASVWR